MDGGKKERTGELMTNISSIKYQNTLIEEVVKKGEHMYQYC